METAKRRIVEILARRGFAESVDDSWAIDVADALVNDLELGCETYYADNAVYRWVSAWFREPTTAKAT